MIINGQQVNCFVETQFEECKVVKGLFPDIQAMMDHTKNCFACLRNMIRTAHMALKDADPIAFEPHANPKPEKAN